MKKIVLVALLAAAGCNKKGGADCDGAIAKAMENFKGNIKEHAANPQIVERMTGVIDKLKGTLTERCKEDKWPPEAVTCFSTVVDRKDMQNCQSKLSPEQASKLTTEITKAMMGGTAGLPRMPPGLAGHPDTLSGGGGSAAAPTPPSAPPAAGSAAPAAPTPTPAPDKPAAGGW